MTDPTEQEKKDELAFELIMRRYDATFEFSEELDTKAGNLIGYISIVTGLIIGLGTFDLLDKIADSNRSIPYFVGIGLLIASMVAALAALRTMKWYETPELRWLQDYWIKAEFTKAQMMRKVASRMILAVDANRINNKRKAELIGISWGCLIAGMTVLLIYLAIFVSSGGTGSSLPE